MAVPVTTSDEYVFNKAVPGFYPSVLANDSDALSASVVFTTGYGELQFGEDGSFNYTTYDPFFVGSDSFVYRAQNESGESIDTLVSITVEGPPKGVADVYETNEQGFVSVIKEFGLLVNDLTVGDTTVDTRPGTEPVFIPGPGGVLGVSLVQPIFNPSYGSLSLYDTGAFFYTPFDPEFTGTDTFVYRATNEFGESLDTLVTINVPTPRGGPIAVEDTYNFDLSTGSLVIGALNGVLANDASGNGAPIIAGIDFQTSYGSVQLNQNGAFTYTPFAGTDFGGGDTDQFIYTAYGSDNISKQTLVTIYIDDGILNA